MEENNDGLEKVVIDKKHKTDEKQAPESNECSDNGKTSKNLGDGRWEYHGKTYKEESIGKGNK
jgi:hypothetical protein